MLEELAGRPWFRWSLAIAFLVVMFAGARLAGPPNYQVGYQPEHGPEPIDVSISPDERLADYTEALAGFTMALVVIGGFQVWLLFRTDKTSRINANVAARQANNAEKQTALMKLQADILDMQKTISRTQFFATHRPQLEVKFVRLLPIPSDQIPDEQPVRGEFVVINTGPVGAIVVGSRVRFEWFYPEDIPTPPELAGADSVPHRYYNAGVTDTVQVETDGWGGLNRFHGDGRKFLFLIGWIVYVDARGEELGTSRTTYFCRIFDPITELFAPNPQRFPDWEFTH